MTLRVNTLGNFEITDDKEILNDSLLKSDVLKRLFVFILMHRDRSVSVSELSDVMWNEDEIVNPTGALKNLMYRLRNALKKSFGDNDYIITGKGSYSWNCEIEVLLDCEEFEALCNTGVDSEYTDSSFKAFEKAMDLYKGDFLDNAQDSYWVMTMSAYYHSMFLTAVKKLAEMYLAKEMYSQMEVRCSEALRIDKSDEALYSYYILSLVRQNKYKMATENYDIARKTLSGLLDTKNLPILKKVHKELLSMKGSNSADNITYIHENIVEDNEASGVYICGYPIFKELYRIEARKKTRSKVEEYIILFTVSIEESAKNKTNDKVSGFLINHAMKNLEKSFRETLRVGDVAARYSDSQYVLMLPTSDDRGTRTAIERILENVRKKAISNDVKITTSFEPVLDANIQGLIGEQ